MSKPTETTTTTFLGSRQNTAVPQQNTEQSRGVGRIWNTAKWAVGGALWGVSRPIAWAFSPIGDGLGSGLVHGAKKEFEQLIQPEGPFGTQLKQTLEQALLHQPPAELIVLKTLLTKVLNTPDALTLEDLIAIDTYLQFLSKNDYQLLKQLAPDLSDQGIECCKNAFAYFSLESDDEFFSDDEDSEIEDTRDRIVDTLKDDEVKNKIADFHQIFTMLLDRNQGVLIQSLAHLRDALLAEESGVMAQAVDLLTKKCTDEDTGLMKLVVNQLNDLLHKEGGAIDRLSNKLSGDEESIIGQAVQLLQTKLLDKDGIVDQLGKKFNDIEAGIITDALKIAASKFDEILKDSLLLLKNEMTEEGGLLSLMKQKLSGRDGILEEAIRLLNNGLFNEADGTVARLRLELNDNDRGILSEALKKLAAALNDKNDGILAQGIDLLKQKLNAEEDGILPSAIRLLEHKLNGPEGVIEKLQHRLLNQHDGTLTQALDRLQEKLNHERTGILAQSLELIESRLLAENGLIDTLGKKLNDEENGILAQAIHSLKASFEKADGPLDLLDQRLQQTLSRALEIVSHKCLDERDGLVAQTITLLTEKLNAENGLLDTLTRRLNDPTGGMIAQAITTLNLKLNGTFDLLEHKLLHEDTGLLTKAIGLLSTKLQENVAKVEEQLLNNGGIIDRAAALLQKRLVDADGLLDQTMNLLDERLNHEERGLLVRAKKYLSETLNDEREGIIAKALDVLSTKLYSPNGLIDTLDVRLNHEDTGILSKALNKLTGKDGVVDTFDQRLTAQAHPLLLKSRTECIRLREALHANRPVLIKQHSKSLETVLGQLQAYRTAVFTAKMPLEHDDAELLEQLKGYLPLFYGDHPPSQEEMLLSVEAGLSVIERYYGNYAGTADRMGDILLEKIDPILRRVENLPTTMVNNLFQRTPSEETSENPSGLQEGTISDFLTQGSSILKSILDKGIQAVSGQALSSFASALKFGIAEVTQKIDNVEARRQLEETLLPTVLALETAINEGSNWNQLYTQIKNAAAALSGVKIYVNGFRIPQIGTSSATRENAEAHFSKNIQALQQAIETPSSKPENQEWRSMVQLEQKKLIDNAAAYLTIKNIYEVTCSLTPPDEQFYLRLIQSARKGENKDGKVSKSELKRLLLEKLEERNINLWDKFWVHLKYFFGGKIIKSVTTKATTSYFTEIFHEIEKNKGDKFAFLRDLLTTNLIRYLTILGGAYQKIATNPSPKGTINELIGKEMQTEESNLGLSTEKMYLDLTQDIFQKGTGSGWLSWFSRPLSYFGKKLFATELHWFVENATRSVQDTNGYAHAINSVILEELEEVWKLLQVSLAEGIDPQHPEALGEPSEARKAQLTAVLKNLFEVLRKSKCNTLDELRSLIEGNLLSAKINGAIDDLFIEDVMEKVTNILTATIQSLLKEDQLQRLTYKFAHLVNNTFEVGEAATAEQMQAEERKIALLGEQILRFSVDKAVQDKFDFTGKKQQNETNGYIEELHQRSMTYFEGAAQDLNRLAALGNTSPDVAKNLTSKIIEEALAYETECYRSSLEAKGSKINSDNKDEVKERYLNIAKKSESFVEAIAAIQRHEKTLQNKNAAIPLLNQIKLILPALALRAIVNPATTLEDNDFAANQLEIAKLHLEELKKMNCCSQQHMEQMRTSIVAISQILVTTRRALQTRTLGVNLAQPRSLIDQIAAEKTQSFGQLLSSPSLNTKLNQLRQELSESIHPTLLPQLLDKLDSIKRAQIPQQVATAQQEFLGLLRSAVDQAAQTIAQERQKYELEFQGISAVIDQTQLLNPAFEQTTRASLQLAIQNAQQELATLKTWESSNFRLVTYSNYDVADMKGIQDWAGEVVYNRIKERQEGLFNFVREPVTYQYGLNHLVLIPYVQRLNAKNPT